MDIPEQDPIFCSICDAQMKVIEDWHVILFSHKDGAPVEYARRLRYGYTRLWGILGFFIRKFIRLIL